MVTISVDLKDFQKLLGVTTEDIEELDALVAISKAEIEEIEVDEETGEKTVRIDIKTSNRPDLWCGEGIAREVKGFLGKELGLPNLAFQQSGYKVIVKPGLEEIRPYIAMAIVKNVTLSDYLIKQLIQLQEKVDFSYGRKRKRTSIGFYDLDLIKFPVEYKTAPKDLSFKPLNTEEIMTIEQILQEHPKGIEYGHILSSCKDNYPILMDAENKVLSFPPIINSDDLGHIVETTKNLLVEVTGTDIEAVNIVVNLIAQTLQDRGGEVYTVTIEYPATYGNINTKYLTTPQTIPNTIEAKVSDINKYLGTKFTQKEMINLLKKRRLQATAKGKSKILVEYPPYRFDFLHWVDVSEEVAIAADYNKLTPTKVKAVTIGKLMEQTKSENLIRRLLLGFGAMEVQSYTLSSLDILVDKMNQPESMKKKIITLKNPTTLTYSAVRNRILPILLEFLSKNTHHEYPQMVYEVGEAVRLEGKKPVTYSSACFAVSGPKQDFGVAHSYLDILMKLLKTEYSLVEVETPEFLPGRVAKIIVKNDAIGVIGEVHPAVLSNFGITQPTAAFEIDLSKLPTLNCKPFHTF